MTASSETQELETTFARLAFDLASACDARDSLSAIFAAQRSVLLRPVAPLFEVFSGSNFDGVEMVVDAPAGLEVPARIASTVSEFIVEGFRNWRAHGLQSPAERRFSNRPPQARVLLLIRVGPRGIEVELHDDGPGLNPERLIDRARMAGILSDSEAREMGVDSREGRLDAVRDLSFHQGLSTRDEAGWDAGRGVGLSRLRQLTEEAGGSISAGASRRLGGFLLRVDLPCPLLGLCAEPLDDSLLQPALFRSAHGKAEGSGQFRIFYRTPPESRDWIRRNFGSEPVSWISLLAGSAEFRALGLRLDAPNV